MTPARRQATIPADDGSLGRQGEGMSSDVDALRFFSRSPHPYRRHRPPPDLSAPGSHETSSPSPERVPSFRDQRQAGNGGKAIMDKSPSESGTEADDEAYGLVKALPAPPLRPRKGLRLPGSATHGDDSPSLTPSQVEEWDRKFGGKYFKMRKDSPLGSPSTDDETRAAKKKYIKRQRAEIVRRTTELALLVGIGAATVLGSAHPKVVTEWHRELLSYAAAVTFLVILYPVRLLYYAWQRSRSAEKRTRACLRIPSAFDPAPLLYPVFLPVIVALSLVRTFPRALLINCVLGLASVPPPLIPFHGHGPGISVSHWLITVIPLVFAQNTEVPATLFPPKPYMIKLPPPEGLDPEVLAVLFALHRALIPPLHYLTTTSLLPAELQLLSTGLINLLLLSETPQATILSCLLWMGSVGLFVFCGHVLHWEVALSRIPKWRLRRAARVIKTRNTFLGTLRESLARTITAANGEMKPQSLESDADEDSPELVFPRRKGASLLKVDPLGTPQKTSPKIVEPRSAVERARQPDFAVSGLDGTPCNRKRSSTLPVMNAQYRIDTVSSESTRQRKIKSSSLRTFLSLTPAQAAFRKWAYAAYAYAVMALLILFPIRSFVSKHALEGAEPFRWAIGYLFGDIRRLRFEIVRHGLDGWIPLVPLADRSADNVMGRADRIRYHVFGASNTRLLLIAYFLLVLVLGMTTVFRLSSIAEVDTRRKVFHGMMVLMMLPTIPIDPCFVALAFSLVLAVFLLLDLIRASQLPPLSKPLASFLTPYVDGRDLRGPVVVSHIFLLIGCAIPLWLSLAAVNRVDAPPPFRGWEVETRDLGMVAGVVCVGMGDAAASLIGRRFGRRKWPWAGGKSLEGSVAFAGAVAAGLLAAKMWLGVGGWKDAYDDGLGSGWLRVEDVVRAMPKTAGKAVVAAAGASLMEAVLTGGNDNVIVPVALWLLVRGVRL